MSDELSENGLRVGEHDRAIRRTVALVAALNLGYFFVEASVATAIGSVALFADSVDFLEDAAINLLILMALGWSAGSRRIVGLGLAALILVPGAAALWTVYQRLTGDGAAPDAVLLTLTGLGALAVNATAALLLARVSNAGGSLTKAAFLSARNDVAANIAIIGAGLAVAATGSFWPDVVVGLGIALMNLDAAREVVEAALGEHDDEHRSNEKRPGASDARP
ncbi:MAG: cation transporter [Hyphomicrobium sp.]|nr:cation transporter [Hyphomicrobium sp.]